MSVSIRRLAALVWTVACALVAFWSVEVVHAEGEARDPDPARPPAPHASGNEAESVPLATAAAADALFRKAREALVRGDYAEACSKFEESYRLQRAVGTLLNLAICEEQRGHGTKAIGLYREVIHWLGDGDERLAIAQQRLVNLEQQLPAATIRLRDDSGRRASVWVDGIELRQASFGVALPLEVGRHDLLIKSPGHADRSIRFELGPAERRDIMLEVGAKLPRPASPHPQVPPTTFTPRERPIGRPGATQRTIGYAALGAAGGALVFGAVSGILVLDRDRIVRDQCPEHECTPRGLAAARAADRYAAWSTMGFVGAAAAGVLGTTLLLTLPSRPATPTSLIAGVTPLARVNDRGAPPLEWHLAWSGHW